MNFRVIRWGILKGGLGVFFFQDTLTRRSEPTEWTLNFFYFYFHCIIKFKFKFIYSHLFNHNTTTIIMYIIISCGYFIMLNLPIYVINDSAGSHLQYWLYSTGSECGGKYLSFFEQYFKILRVKSRAPCDVFYHRFVSIGKYVLCWYRRGGGEIGGYGGVFLKYRNIW